MNRSIFNLTFPLCPTVLNAKTAAYNKETTICASFKFVNVEILAVSAIIAHRRVPGYLPR